uniref:Longin domain-containing protein n=1 Tax=Mantoniella antarctica TaxID=81844 RepID=A0A7S0SF33_9CHLO|mmetsp:Transcript_21914/g.54196  ORF Transcript_21914/g.54196 Transcript_21914/m.54196 type:complete len:223 (+) Transcript_21914:430-1098(+)|eukprot:CAMPEP_0181362492 /NCGR_PEP_ID=MMETSP1106-20121128/8050_1 /TAXON_ID=81844 /ORGANISM="Mantoniella antarctica, Strain SL-175" /LENGTH=222 /DNA_ID=CAMNT_0023476479 /DNA_START=477 /DNA_END=1145 /DNA_ORIENTATION=+
MVKLTMLARVADGLPLAEGLDSDRGLDLEQYKQQAKTLFKKLSQGPPPPSRMSYESGPYFLHYMIEQGVCYLTLSDRGYPKKLAYQYLEDLQKEFNTQNGSQVETVARPYAFIKFDTFIQRTKKLYLDTRTQRNLNKLSEDLHDIQSVMTRNIQDILGQGERIEHVSSMSQTLANETRKYSSKAKDLSRQALIQKYLPIVIVLGFVLILLFLRFYVFAGRKK